VPHDLYTDAYYVPGNAKFVKLGRRVEESEITEMLESAADGATDGRVIITGWNGQIKTAFHVVETGDSIIAHNMFNDTYYVPTKAAFIKIASFSQTAPVDEEEVNLHFHSVGRDSAGLYFVSGPEFIKYAKSHDVRNLSYHDVA